jgi:hypothetical protein
MTELDGVPIYSTTSLCADLGFTASANFIESVGIEPAVITSTGVYWYKHDFGRLCFALARYLAELSDGRA